MSEFACTHRWDFKRYGVCPMCLEEIKKRNQVVSGPVMQCELTNKQLDEIRTISHTVDIPSRHIRMMAAELLRWRTAK